MTIHVYYDRELGHAVAIFSPGHAGEGGKPRVRRLSSKNTKLLSEVINRMPQFRVRPLVSYI